MMTPNPTVRPDPAYVRMFGGDGYMATRRRLGRWLLESEYGEERNYMTASEIDQTINGGTVVDDDSAISRWQGEEIEFRATNSGHYIRHTSDPDTEKSWWRVDLPRDFHGRLHYFTRLIHERQAFDRGHMPTGPAKFTELDLDAAVEATFTAGLRLDRIARARRMIAEGAVDTPAKLDAACVGLEAELIKEGAA